MSAHPHPPFHRRHAIAASLLLLALTLLWSSRPAAAAGNAARADIAVCRRDGTSLSGNYAAVQTQAYDDSCVLRTGALDSSPMLVPVGSNDLSEGPRVEVLQDEGAVRLSLGGTTSNRLAAGRRGRIELADCFESASAFLRRPTDEQQSRVNFAEVNAGCDGASRREMAYESPCASKTAQGRRSRTGTPSSCSCM